MEAYKLSEQLRLLSYSDKTSERKTAPRRSGWQIHLLVSRLLSSKGGKKNIGVNRPEGKMAQKGISAVNQCGWMTK